MAAFAGGGTLEYVSGFGEIARYSMPFLKNQLKSSDHLAYSIAKYHNGAVVGPTARRPEAHAGYGI
jgi:hypothetical protein